MLLSGCRMRRSGERGCLGRGEGGGMGRVKGRMGCEARRGCVEECGCPVSTVSHA